VEGYTANTVSIEDSPFDLWKIQKFGSVVNANGADASDLADPEGDGVCNIMEFARGSDPLKVEHFPIATPSLGQYVYLSFPRSSSATDLRYTVQASADLETWADGSSYSSTSSSGSNTVTTEVSRVMQGTTETITVRDNVPVTAKTPRFLRLRVERN
jgi:hypothetical protein